VEMIFWNAIFAIATKLAKNDYSAKQNLVFHPLNSERTAYRCRVSLQGFPANTTKTTHQNIRFQHGVQRLLSLFEELHSYSEYL